MDLRASLCMVGGDTANLALSYSTEMSTRGTDDLLSHSANFAMDDMPGDEYFSAFYQNEDVVHRRADFGHVPLKGDDYPAETGADDGSDADDVISSCSVDRPLTNVAVFRLGTLFPMDQGLASKYTLVGKSPSSICRTNQVDVNRVEYAASHWVLIEPQDLARAAGNGVHVWAWGVAALICDRSSSNADDWSRHPFGGRLARRLVDSCWAVNDVQMAALLSSVLGLGESYDGVRFVYANCLYRYGQLSQSAELLSFTKGNEELASRSAVRFALQSVRCALCSTILKGAIQFCSTCLHGGHRSHLQQWFRTQSRCPTAGCACRCQLVN